MTAVCSAELGEGTMGHLISVLPADFAVLLSVRCVSTTWRRGDPTTDNVSATEATNASLNKAGEVGIMSIFLNLFLTRYPARAVGGTVPPDTVSVLLAGPLAVETKAPRVR